MREVHFFDPNDEVAVLERRLPHWSQPVVVCFITFRAIDSMPRNVVEQFHADRRHWLRSHHVDPDCADWRQQLTMLEREKQHEFYQAFSSR